MDKEKMDSLYELTDDEICQVICGDNAGCGERGKPNPDCYVFNNAVKIVKAHNKKLAVLRTVYVKVPDKPEHKITDGFLLQGGMAYIPFKEIVGDE